MPEAQSNRRLLPWLGEERRSLAGHRRQTRGRVQQASMQSQAFLVNRPDGGQRGGEDEVRQPPIEGERSFKPHVGAETARPILVRIGSGEPAQA